MPSGPPELHERWQSDTNAMQFLEQRGFVLKRDWTWIAPHEPVTADEASALTYLILEWDFGDISEVR